MTRWGDVDGIVQGMIFYFLPFYITQVVHSLDFYIRLAGDKIKVGQVEINLHLPF